MIFHMDIQGSHRLKFFNTIVQCLMDFSEVNPSVPVATFFQEMNDRKTITAHYLQLSLPNLACYLSCIPFEQIKEWEKVFPPCDQFFRRLWSLSCGSSVRGSGSGSANAETARHSMSLRGKDGSHGSEDILKLGPQVSGGFIDIFRLHKLIHI